MPLIAMKKTARFVALLAGPALLANCAQIPRSTLAESQFSALSCAELAREVQVTENTRAVAEQAKSDSWHAILPFVVAARYADASSATTEAQRRLELLAAQSKQRSCAS